MCELAVNHIRYIFFAILSVGEVSAVTVQSILLETMEKIASDSIPLS